MERLVIIGAGGSARDVLEIAEACIEAGAEYDVLGFVVDAEFGAPGTDINGRPILGGLEWFEAQPHNTVAVCAVGSPEVRKKLVTRAQRTGARFANLVHPTAIVRKRVRLGEGVIIAAGVICTTNIVIGDHVHVNLACTIAHDCTLENFVTLAPGVHLSGNVFIKEGSFLGTGAAVIETKMIGSWSVIGAGGVVIDDIPPNVVAVGTPAKVLTGKSGGWHPQT